MSAPERTFCRPEVKWLCQKRVMRSVSGERVVSISVTHQFLRSMARSTCCRWNCFLSSGDRSRTRRGEMNSPTHAGGGVRAWVAAPVSTRSTASRRERRAIASI